MKKKQQTGARSKAAYVVVMAIALIAVGIVVFTNSPNTARTVSAQSDKAQKKYRGTRKIVKDSATGEARLPNDEEVDRMISSLAGLTKQAEGLSETSARNGAVAIDLEGGFGGTMLARLSENGSFETKCVFTFEEGTEFLGLVEDPTR